jgi:CxxC-x17-CxxC domain-containing protein
LYNDEQLTCTDCGAQFVFTSGEQAFFENKGFQNKPNRCPDCRATRKAQRNASGGQGRPSGGGHGPREMVRVTCSSCGQEAEVPFVPRGDKPVYCNDCFSRQRPSFR